MIPAQQRLERRNLVAVKVDDGLIVQFESALRQRLSQIELQLATGVHASIHLWLEELVCTAPLALGPVKCKIGILQEFVWKDCVTGSNRNADAGPNEHLVIIDFVGSANCFNDAQRQSGGAPWLIRPRLDYSELVATEPGNGISTPDTIAQSFGYNFQKLIAGGVPKCVVHALEAVKIKPQDRGGLLRRSILERCVEPLSQ